MPLIAANSHYRVAVLALVGVLITSPASGQGVPTAARPEPPNSAAQAQNPAQPPPAPVRVIWDNRPTLVMGPLRLGLRARLQTDIRRSEAPLEDDETVSDVDVARRRIGVEGTLGDIAEFQIEREIGVEEPWRDVFINYRQFQPIRFQFGKFKMPFGLEQNVSATNLDFVYRSLASRTLTPGRDRGYMVHGELLDEIVRYEIGRFGGDGANARSRSGSRVSTDGTTAARITIEPFRSFDSLAEDLQAAVSWTEGTLESEGFSSIRGQTVMGEPFFVSNYPVLGDRHRLGYEVRWRPGPVSAQAEYVRLTEDRQGLSVEDTDLSVMRAVGWYLSGTWAITGDSKADGLDETEHPLGQGGIGAVEVAVRFERLTFDSAATGEAASTSPRAEVIIGNSNRVVTFGVNWYLNRWIKIQFNLMQETIADPELGPLPSKPTFSGRVLRFQFSL